MLFSRAAVDRNATTRTAFVRRCHSPDSARQRRAQAVRRQRDSGFGGLAVGGVVANPPCFRVEGKEAAHMLVGAEAEIGAEAVLVAIMADEPDGSFPIDEEG